jgi:hypothetical protein
LWVKRRLGVDFCGGFFFVTFFLRQKKKVKEQNVSGSKDF